MEFKGAEIVTFSLKVLRLVLWDDEGRHDEGIFVLKPEGTVKFRSGDIQFRSVTNPWALLGNSLGY